MAIFRVITRYYLDGVLAGEEARERGNCLILDKGEAAVDGCLWFPWFLPFINCSLHRRSISRFFYLFVLTTL